MKRLQLNPVTSDITISIYILITLFLRFKYENLTSVGVFESIIMGLCFVTIIWVFIKLKVLNPNWFGLFNSKTPKP